MKKVGNYNIINKTVCTRGCHCGWNVEIGGENVADLARLMTFLEGEWEYELGYLTNEDIPTPKGVKGWVWKALQGDE